MHLWMKKEADTHYMEMVMISHTADDGIMGSLQKGNAMKIVRHRGLTVAGDQKSGGQEHPMGAKCFRLQGA